MATCFHHQDRETGRACTRCGRAACPDCLIQASVGSQCFECVKRGAPKKTVRIRQTLERDPLIATKLITAIILGAFVLIAVRDGSYDGNGHTAANLALIGRAIPVIGEHGVHDGEWWRLLSYSLVHFGLFHLGGNLLMLWIVGRVLEPGTGPVRFATLYIVSVLGGAAGALLVSPNAFTGGASGGVFGVAAAAALVLHRQGIRFWDSGIGPLLVINLALGLFVSNISLGGHIGGLVAGALTAEAMLRARRLGLPALGYIGAAIVAVASVGLAFAVVG
jgi:membrane associated rhomboid family serine protease